ncbi:MAG: hypothetical protein HYT98_01020 [Candidatus Sungbacteria bacterium]|nr:hypothetical protein [Candidatus Sungbacteria bacterium]
MALKERQKSILEAIIQEYIDTAHPVASRELVRGSRFGLSSATIRNEMLELDEMGYLEQPHTSAGRIPTDKGFRFYVDEISAVRTTDGKKNSGGAARFVPLRADKIDEFLHDATKLMAELSHSFAVLGIPARHNFEKCGFSAIMQEPEFTDEAFAREFAELADEFEDVFRGLLDDCREGELPRVFIGSENPVHSARRCGVVVSRMLNQVDQSGFIALIGPKRMDYRKNISLIGEFKQYAGKFAK